jgi:hypothetical protein
LLLEEAREDLAQIQKAQAAQVRVVIAQYLALP